MNVKSDHRCEFSNLSDWKEEALFFFVIDNRSTNTQDAFIYLSQTYS